MSVVSFGVRHRDDLQGVAEIVSMVDGRALTDLARGFDKATGMETRDVSYGGLVPSSFRLGPLSRSGAYPT